MKTIEEYLIDIIGYGEEANILMFYRPLMLAVVSYKCRQGFIYELVKFTDSDGLFISPDCDIMERDLMAYTIYCGSLDNIVKVYNVFCSFALEDEKNE